MCVPARGELALSVKDNCTGPIRVVRRFCLILVAGVSWLALALVCSPAIAQNIYSQNSLELPGYSKSTPSQNSAKPAPLLGRQNSEDIRVLPTRRGSNIATQNTRSLEGCWQGAFNDMAKLTILDPKTALLYRTGRCHIEPFIVSYRFCAKDLGGAENISTYDSLVSAPGISAYQELEKHGSFDAESGTLSLVIVSKMRSDSSCVGEHPDIYKYTRTLTATISDPRSLRATFSYKQFYSQDGSNWFPLFAGSDTEVMSKE